ncbi:LytTR family DNA-binding domain-containing protein [Tenacibaculum finnmarkense genomovar ulcerans]|uniref:LytR/AlgR family response regulator transcription factor n=1 Tax=Tenacibaculum finnmarkense TaxID=2781243 RepID=UPI00187B721E|nr:LytTR family DNA-binding domain-containing protein [Tenacibaculum finnmarkense]MBE7647373.1 response regulator [Tenacibaculum finnmarkense genomovar ulcerans]MCD8431905.1 LytTR family DNA-binding domain-containing protein [Tenacibaculum finnmarkense genomovar ulcerans]MCG8794521.1 response regulator transcription factor [Tenacibaculum finnmarkense]MCG8796850.1 response regulator transcription factor [Tenacibaculum finnmarkense]MCG8807373.1 response regulator transcription factor [Tenacibacu
MLRAVIVDDEPKAIEGLLWELSNFNDDLEVIQTFTQAEEAIKYINNNAIDCLFLDIEMPTMDGFQLLERLNKKDFAIVITTAYSEYAIKAIKNQAIDYLLKPVDSDDLEETLNRVKNYRIKNKSDQKLEQILSTFSKKFNKRKITINTDGKLIFLKQSEIVFVESDGNYCSIHTINNKKIVVTKKLKEINALLPEEHFFRIHNSFIINLNKLKQFIKSDGYVILEDNHKIPVSRQKKSDFLEKF